MALWEGAVEKSLYCRRSRDINPHLTSPQRLFCFFSLRMHIHAIVWEVNVADNVKATE